MKKWNFLFIGLCLLVGIEVKANTYTLQSIKAIGKNPLVYDENNQPITGIVKFSADEDGKSNSTAYWLVVSDSNLSFRRGERVEISYEKGIKTSAKIYDEDDLLIKEIPYTKGKVQDGIIKEYSQRYPGELESETELKNKLCVQRTVYKNGKKYQNLRQITVGEASLMDFYQFQPYDFCKEGNSVVETYYPNGNIFQIKDPFGQEKWYWSDGSLFLDKTRVEKQYRHIADFVVSGYYKNGNPMVRLTVKEKRNGDRFSRDYSREALGGEFYSEQGEKTILDKQKAWDWWLDLYWNFHLQQKGGK